MPALPDPFQERYLRHQEIKQSKISAGQDNLPFHKYSQEEQEGFFHILNDRRSRRFYSSPISRDIMAKILEAASLAPSSCNRKAVEIISADKPLDSLVGGRGWLNKAPQALLFYANMSAYKLPAEVSFMPYLDTGFIAENIYLACEALGVSCCFINPNRTDNTLNIEGKLFTGAMSIGMPNNSK